MVCYRGQFRIQKGTVPFLYPELSPYNDIHDDPSLLISVLEFHIDHPAALQSLHPHNLTRAA